MQFVNDVIVLLCHPLQQEARSSICDNWRWAFQIGLGGILRSPFVSQVHRIFSQRFWGIYQNHQDSFLKNGSLCSFWSAVVSSLELSHFCSGSFLYYVILTGTSEACSSLDAILGSLVTSYTSCWCALAVLILFLLAHRGRYQSWWCFKDLLWPSPAILK